MSSVSDRVAGAAAAQPLPAATTGKTEFIILSGKHTAQALRRGRCAKFTCWLPV